MTSFDHDLDSELRTRTRILNIVFSAMGIGAFLSTAAIILLVFQLR